MAHDHPGEQAIFGAARNLDDDADGTTRFAEACGDDPVLRERISNLLRVWKDSFTFLELLIPRTGRRFAGRADRRT